MISETENGLQATARLHVKDRSSKVTFLVDTGADLSVIPKPTKWNGGPNGIKLYAVNGSTIDVFGVTRRELSIGLPYKLAWNFTVADVPHAIIGADLLSYYHLLPDLKLRRLIDGNQMTEAPALVKAAQPMQISFLAPSHKYAHIFSKFPQVVGPDQFRSVKSRDVFHHILTTGPPISQRAHRLRPEKLKAAKQVFRKMCEAGICRPSSSSWASPLHMVPKKNGEWRPCGNYIKLNAVTVPDKYPVPQVSDCMTFCSGKRIFTALDLRQAYHQIPVAPEDIPKTAVITPFGLYEFPVMTFGLRNASQTFQRYINSALGDLDFVFVYIDDILVASSSEEEHQRHLELVLTRLNQYELLINLEKCTLGVTELVFLGHLISSSGFKPNPDKVKAIQDFPQPTNVDELRRFLGLVNSYRRLIAHAAETQRPLCEFLKGARKKDKRPIVWTEEAEAAFVKCKEDLVNLTFTAFPRENEKLRLICDASDLAMGAALEQGSGEFWHPLAFFSKKFSPAQQKYATYDRELTAIYEAIRYFHHDLEGVEFEILTDHKPLVFALQQSTDKMPAIRVRRLAYIAQFNAKILYLPGKDNVVADSLSRINAFIAPTCFDWSNPCLSSDSSFRKVLANIEAFRLPTLFDAKRISLEQQADPQLKEIVENADHPLKLRRLTCGPEHSPFYCDLREDVIRPYVPLSLRRDLFDAFHALSHPGPKVTLRLINQQYVWPNMTRDIKAWCKNCIACQQCKVSRHNKFIPNHFITPDARFDHVHLDIVGPLPSSCGYTHLLTVIDRYSRWAEAIPIADTLASTIARAFFDSWITRFGTPVKITTDQGAQFESKLWSELLTILGISRSRTSAYHPESNGMVERLHRDIKAALMCHGVTENWARLLPTVMLGLRTRIRREVDASPADLVFGKALRIPGDFAPLVGEEPDVRLFYNEFRDFMRQLRPVPVAHNRSIKPFLHQGLEDCTHVWMRSRPIKPALSPPYVGPFKVISRNKENHTFVIEVDKTQKTVSIDRLKPAFFARTDYDGVKEVSPEPSNLSFPVESVAQPIACPDAIRVNDKTVPNDHPVLNVDIPSNQTNTKAKEKRTKFVPNILRRHRCKDNDQCSVSLSKKRVTFAVEG